MSKRWANLVRDRREESAECADLSGLAHVFDAVLAGLRVPGDFSSEVIAEAQAVTGNAALPARDETAAPAVTVVSLGARALTRNCTPSAAGGATASAVQAVSLLSLDLAASSASSRRRRLLLLRWWCAEMMMHVTVAVRSEPVTTSLRRLVGRIGVVVCEPIGRILRSRTGWARGCLSWTRS
jgi:hypothetical protein